MQVLASRVLLRPADLDRAVGFYEDGLGLVRFREWGQRPHRGIVYFLGGGYLELTEHAAPGPRPAGVRLWMQVANCAAAHDELMRRGVVVADPPERRPWGLIEMEFDDPDGLRLVVVETPLDHPLRRRD